MRLVNAMTRCSALRSESLSASEELHHTNSPDPILRAPRPDLLATSSCAGTPCLSAPAERSIQSNESRRTGQWPASPQLRSELFSPPERCAHKPEAPAKETAVLRW